MQPPNGELVVLAQAKNQAVLKEKWEGDSYVLASYLLGSRIRKKTVSKRITTSHSRWFHNFSKLLNNLVTHEKRSEERSVISLLMQRREYCPLLCLTKGTDVL